MISIKHSPEVIRKNIAWSGEVPPSRLCKAEGVKPPPRNAEPPGVTEFPDRDGGAVREFTGDGFHAPGGPLRKPAPSLSGDPGNPRPPTRDELIKLLKGCDKHGKEHRFV